VTTSSPSRSSSRNCLRDSC